MYRSNRSSSLGRRRFNSMGAVLPEGYYRPDNPTVRKLMTQWDPQYTFASPQDIADTYNAAPADIARPQTVGYPWALVVKPTDPEQQYRAGIFAPKKDLAASLSPNDPLIAGTGDQYISLFHVGGNPIPAGYNQYGVIGTPEDFGEQTGGDATAPAPTATSNGRTTRDTVTSPAPQTNDNGDKNPAPTSPVVPPLVPVTGGQDTQFMLMLAGAAAAGYFISGKSAVGAMAGAAVGWFVMTRNLGGL